MNLVYLVFGNNVEIHNQANFSILTFLLQKEHIEHIIIVTDEPSYYKHLKNDKIKIEQINQAQLNDWKGEYNFFWRIKIKAIEYVSNSYKSQSLVYLDADTFGFQNLNKIAKTLNKGHNIMHLNEGKLSEIKSKTTKKMWKQIKNKSFGAIQIQENDCMWNAGVVGISKANISETIPLALAICDEMCEHKVTDRLIEQFALSVALNKTGELMPVDSYIGHYWGNKDEWNTLINTFFLKSHLSSFTFEEELASIKNIDFTQLPIHIKIPNTRERLTKVITKVFPEKYRTYINS